MAENRDAGKVVTQVGRQVTTLKAEIYLRVEGDPENSKEMESMVRTFVLAIGESGMNVATDPETAAPSAASDGERHDHERARTRARRKRRPILRRPDTSPKTAQTTESSNTPA